MTCEKQCTANPIVSFGIFMYLHKWLILFGKLSGKVNHTLIRGLPRLIHRDLSIPCLVWKALPWFLTENHGSFHGCVFPWVGLDYEMVGCFSCKTCTNQKVPFIYHTLVARGLQEGKSKQLSQILPVSRHYKRCFRHCGVYQQIREATVNDVFSITREN